MYNFDFDMTLQNLHIGTLYLYYPDKPGICALGRTALSYICDKAGFNFLINLPYIFFVGHKIHVKNFIVKFDYIPLVSTGVYFSILYLINSNIFNYLNDNQRALYFGARFLSFFSFEFRFTKVIFLNWNLGIILNRFIFSFYRNSNNFVEAGYQFSEFRRIFGFIFFSLILESINLNLACSNFMDKFIQFYMQFFIHFVIRFANFTFIEKYLKNASN